MKKGQALINGKLVTSQNTIKIIAPTTLEVIGEVPALDNNEINAAFLSARQAQKSWEQLSIQQRVTVINRWKTLILENAVALADLMMLEIAKNKTAALTEVKRSVEGIDFIINETYHLQPEAYTGESFNINNKLAIFSRVAKGVVLAIAPFNYPVNLALLKIIPALIMGNTVVFKPASQGSLTGLFLAKLAFEANFPPGVFNAVSGYGRVIGDQLVTHPEINVISFTGSETVGKHIAKIANKVDLILELGGKDPALVLEDCDLVTTAQKIIKGAFNYSGQRCTAIKRILVPDTIAPDLVNLLKIATEQLTVGLPEDNADITPVIDTKTSTLMTTLINDAIVKGANIITGNSHQQNLWTPTIIDNVTPDMELAWVEPFAPVLPIIRFNNIEEAIKIINDSRYGLQASIFTKNIDRAVKIAKQLDVGTVNLNDGSQRGPDSFPFLGVKDSGLGVQGIRETLLAMSRLKGLVFNWE